MKKHSLILALSLVVNMAGCAANTDTKPEPQNEDISITITAPSDENGPVTPGHSFFISGTITNDEALSEGTSLRVSVLDKEGKEVRFASSSRKDDDSIDRFTDAFFYYADDVDPKRSDIHAREFPCLIVEDTENPDASLKNANIKCFFSDKDFNAFIPYATDKAHGLLIDDGIGYVDEAGNPYNALPEGNYTASAVLTDSSGKVITSAQKQFSIEPAKNTILCRFHPDEHYENMKTFAAEKKLSMNIDYLPGYYKDQNGNDKGGLRAMFIGGDAALYNGSHVNMFEYLASPTSSSLTIELPFIEKYYNINDPEVFTAYYYDIGEPSVSVGDKTIKGKIVSAETGDKLILCRADLSNHGTEGKLVLNNTHILQTDIDLSDGITFSTTDSGELALAGLVVPYQLKDEEILFHPEKNETGLLNRLDKLVYLVWDGNETKNYEKPVNLTRTFADGSEYDSIMEFYHVFAKKEIDPNRDYAVSVYGIDLNGERVDGSKEFFTINNMPQKSLEGTISAENINKYGNVTIDMDQQAFRDAGFEEGDIVTVTIGEKTIDMPFVTDYQDVKRGDPLLVPAEGKLAMWISMGSFAETYEIAERIDSKANSVVWKMSEKPHNPEPVTVSMKQKAGYLEEYTLRRDLAGLTPITEKRSDQTDEEFVNFREVATTGIRPDTLYRSSSPINDRLGRSSIADECIKKHGIDHIINLYDSEETAKAYPGYQGSYASTIDAVYLTMSLDYTSERFRTTMAKVVTYIAEHPGKYVVHCVLGEHRTGAVCMLLSALMGASYEELVKDYMQTYVNLYDVKPGTKQYELLVDDNVNSILKSLFRVDDPENADLSDLAADYIRSAGVSDETLRQVRKNLGI